MDSSSTPPAPASSGLGKKFLIGCGAGCTLLLVLVASGVAFLAWKLGTGAWPDTAVTRGEDLPAFVEELLRDNQVIQPDEEILYFYSAAFTDYLDDGNLLTDQRVIRYGRNGDELTLESARFGEVTAIDPEYADGPLDDTLLLVETDDDVFYLLLSRENGLDQVFVRELEKRVESAR